MGIRNVLLSSDAKRWVVGFWYSLLCHVKFSQEDIPEPHQIKVCFSFLLRKEKFLMRIPKPWIIKINHFSSLPGHRHYAEIIQTFINETLLIFKYLLTGLLCPAMYFANCLAPGDNIYIDYDGNRIYWSCLMQQSHIFCYVYQESMMMELSLLIRMYKITK